jgi:hypothetical protein
MRRGEFGRPGLECPDRHELVHSLHDSAEGCHKRILAVLVLNNPGAVAPALFSCQRDYGSGSCFRKLCNLPLTDFTEY